MLVFSHWPVPGVAGSMRSGLGRVACWPALVSGTTGRLKITVMGESTLTSWLPSAGWLLVTCRKPTALKRRSTGAASGSAVALLASWLTETR